MEDLEKKDDDFNLESGDHRNRYTTRYRGGSRGHWRGNHYISDNRSKKRSEQ
ncbi:hypothetical protein DPMN_012711 [Dreissena polymorpha]|uniref:Uncharacterized protein n=1 Tax=Dreissena polymorpha TaxID=45954 RepID=A0A9D4N8J0_DREPO|nr:hypothetical protein DPMN_012711 [Dreissena polymorpha]